LRKNSNGKAEKSAIVSKTALNTKRNGTEKLHDVSIGNKAACSKHTAGLRLD